MAFQRTVKTDWISLLCKKGCYSIDGVNGPRKGKENIWMLPYLHWWNRGKQVNIILTYSAGVVSSAAHHPYQHCRLIYYHVTLTFSQKCGEKKMLVHLKYAFSKDSSILQMQKKLKSQGKKEKISVTDHGKQWLLSRSGNTGDVFFLVSVCS